MPTSLVTGGAGFIGTHVTNHLIKLGHKVIVLDDLSGGFEDFVNNEAIFIKGSVTDENLISQLFIAVSYTHLTLPTICSV